MLTIYIYFLCVFFPKLNLLDMELVLWEAKSAYQVEEHQEEKK